MVDTLALGASGATREGSSPFIRTKDIILTVTLVET
jgi:hypothetical protein